MNESINQSTNQSINQPINQPINQSINMIYIYISICVCNPLQPPVRSQKISHLCFQKNQQRQVDLSPFLLPPKLPELPDPWWWSETIWSVATEMILAQELRAANSQEGTAPTAQRRKHLDPLEVPKIGQNIGQKKLRIFFRKIFCSFPCGPMRILHGSYGLGWVLIIIIKVWVKWLSR